MKFKAALFSAVMCVGLVGCGRVAAGYEGVIVDMYGSEKGISVSWVVRRTLKQYLNDVGGHRITPTHKPNKKKA